MSAELKQFLNALGIATSRATGYSPQGNGQAERDNGTIWKAVTPTLKSRGLGLEQGKCALPDALSSICASLCMSMPLNAAPHERLFTHPRRHTGDSLRPDWQIYPGTVLLKRRARKSKYEPLVEMVELLDAGPGRAHGRHPDGRETAVSIRHPAPAGPPPADTLPPPGASSPCIPSPGAASSGSSMDATAEAIGDDDTFPIDRGRTPGRVEPDTDTRRGRQNRPPRRPDLR